jgi:hypothetical protein
MGKKTCLDKLIDCTYLHKNVVHLLLSNVYSDASDGSNFDNFWVYGTDNGCFAGNMHWCSNFRPFQPKEVAWAPGEPSSNGSCVYMKSSNASTLATANCSTEMRFLCDVRKKGTEGMALQQECLETWSVTAGWHFNIFGSGVINFFNNSTTGCINQHERRCVNARLER